MSSERPVRHETSFPVPGGFIRVVTESQFVPESSVPATAPTSVPTGETARTEAPQPSEVPMATENQVRKARAEMHRIGEDLATAYLRSHFGTTNPAALTKKTVSEAIRWLVSQPPKKG